MKFPLLKMNEVAVVVADGATGTILNLKGEVYNNDSTEKPYCVFESLVIAQEYIKNKSILNDKFEFVIYDFDQNLLDFIKATYWDKK